MRIPHDFALPNQTNRINENNNNMHQAYRYADVSVNERNDVNRWDNVGYGHNLESRNRGQGFFNNQSIMTTLAGSSATETITKNMNNKNSPYSPINNQELSTMFKQN